MALKKFQDFLSALVSRQRSLFASSDKVSIDELIDRLMGTLGEVSGIVTARQVLDSYNELSDGEKLEFFKSLEQNFNANQAGIRRAFEAYDKNPASSNLNILSKVTEPLRHELLRRLNQTPGATHDLVAMRTDLLGLLEAHPQLIAVDEDFVRLFTSWFGRGFLQLQTIDWSTSAAILERIIRYEAVHEIKDWNDLRSRIEPPNRRCFAYFHPALVDEPLIFVEVALVDQVPRSIASILESDGIEGPLESKYKTAVFYSISNCQPGLKNISFGNFLIKQVVQELQSEFPSIKTFVTLSPIPGFSRWLESDKELDAEIAPEIEELKTSILSISDAEEAIEASGSILKKGVFNYLVGAKKGKYPLDPVARFHLGNGASLYQIHPLADRSEKGRLQSLTVMVNYLYDLRNIESHHESYATDGVVHFSDKLKSYIIKSM
ncbi:MAG: malonyl-CoA decarboxylase [Pseudohongiellaceae bacterium]|uniref:MCD, Malonyl-CoA decarboxylase MCD n=1 Tax=OM182 bacterium MED-G28 TaxID=1986256 RepID=A0A2A5WFZ8_9GAMM|nr:MAG: MCD, Malonyl-CoA decarboxylase MCD [OM182 bacterium MED-G28]